MKMISKLSVESVDNNCKNRFDRSKIGSSFVKALSHFLCLFVIMLLDKIVFSYSEIADTKDFFQAAKRSPRMVVHFYRGVTPRCEIVNGHLHKLAPMHLETRFVKIDAERNPFLVERLGIIILPTIVLIKDGKTTFSQRF